MFISDQPDDKGALYQKYYEMGIKMVEGDGEIGGGSQSHQPNPEGVALTE